MTLENMGMEESLANKQCLFWFLEVERVEVESGKSLSLNIRKSGHAIFSQKNGRYALSTNYCSIIFPIRDGMISQKREKIFYRNWFSNCWKSNCENLWNNVGSARDPLPKSKILFRFLSRTQMEFGTSYPDFPKYKIIMLKIFDIKFSRSFTVFLYHSIFFCHLCAHKSEAIAV